MFFSTKSVTSTIQPLRSYSQSQKPIYPPRHTCSWLCTCVQWYSTRLFITLLIPNTIHLMLLLSHLDSASWVGNASEHQRSLDMHQSKAVSAWRRLQDTPPTPRIRKYWVSPLYPAQKKVSWLPTLGSKIWPEPTVSFQWKIKLHLTRRQCSCYLSSESWRAPMLKGMPLVWQLSLHGSKQNANRTVQNLLRAILAATREYSYQLHIAGIPGARNKVLKSKLCKGL